MAAQAPSGAFFVSTNPFLERKLNRKVLTVSLSGDTVKLLE